jgi:hypothetical protein
VTLTIFICRRGSNPSRCKRCGKPTEKRCSFELFGNLSGKHCDAVICDSCKVCEPHERFAKQRDAELAKPWCWPYWSKRHKVWYSCDAEGKRVGGPYPNVIKAALKAAASGYRCGWSVQPEPENWLQLCEANDHV